MISLNKLIYPYFVIGGVGKKEEIKNFPGIFRFSPDCLLRDIKEARGLGVKKIILFGAAQVKDAIGSDAYSGSNPLSIAIKKIKQEFKDLTVFTDVCLCSYTKHGHCGILNRAGNGIDSGKTLEALSRIALMHAEAGADWVSPSAMAKRQVVAIRKILDKNGFTKVRILGYSAKFASNFYGPFRNVADSSPAFGDRSAYQLDYRSGKRALDEIKTDIKEGADMVMVKPALSYLDVIKEAKTAFDYPTAAYNVSGEYAFVKYGAKQGLWDEREMVEEIITSIKRAGADFIITYHAKDIAKWLK
jgi:porphobilinogen synthase